MVFIKRPTNHSFELILMTPYEAILVEGQFYRFPTDSYEPARSKNRI